MCLIIALFKGSMAAQKAKLKNWTIGPSARIKFRFSVLYRHIPFNETSIWT